MSATPGQGTALFIAGIKVFPDGRIEHECDGEIDAATADRAAEELFRLAMAIRNEARSEVSFF